MSTTDNEKSNVGRVRATNWEFKNRALVFGLIFACSFALYSWDHQNSVAALSNWVSARLAIHADLLARVLFAVATALLIIAAFVRTWASSYLQATIVYAPEVKTESLVADGPYRHMRNPLYFANVFLALGLGAMMSRAGFCLALIAMLVFCYRLIFREEAHLEARQAVRALSKCGSTTRASIRAARPLRRKACAMGRWFQSGILVLGVCRVGGRIHAYAEQHRVLRDFGNQPGSVLVLLVSSSENTLSYHLRAIPANRQSRSASAKR